MQKLLSIWPVLVHLNISEPCKIVIMVLVIYNRKNDKINNNNNTIVANGVFMSNPLFSFFQPKEFSAVLIGRKLGATWISTNSQSKILVICHIDCKSDWLMG